MHDGVYAFDHPHDAPARELADLLGGKGAGLAEMTALGLDVPPGFTIGLPVFREWRQGGWPTWLDRELSARIADLGDRMGRRFGDTSDPLLVSVRSGAAISMPGMLDTVLDLGLTDATVRGLATATGDERFAWDSYARFLRMFATIVMGVDGAGLPARVAHPAAEDVAALQAAIEQIAGRPVPQDPAQQLREAVAAVFSSWDSERAQAYRRREGIDEHAGTAVTVQTMVFGNRGERSGTGVVFTRDPNTGAPGPYGDYLVGGQGEDVVDGSAHPVPIADLAQIDAASAVRLRRVLGRLERHYAHVCDVEFTIEDGTLWLLQTRAAKLSAVAAVRTAVDLAEDPDVALSPTDALARVPVATRDRARADLTGAGAASRSDRSDRSDRSGGSQQPATHLTTALGASPGRATGAVVFTSAAALAATEDVVLVRQETSPADVVGMSASVGILTTRGGLASHAAVVARGWGIPAVVGAEAVRIDGERATVGSSSGAVSFAAGDRITIDGATGDVWLGNGPAEVSAVDLPALAALERLISWDEERSRSAS
jgi:pyruvate, orthophosphate dikinase